MSSKTTIPSRTPARSRGFSLAELVGVLTVLAVVAATAIPAVRMLGDTRAAEVALRLEDFLRQARTAAVGLGVPCGVVIDRQAQTVSLVMLDAGEVEPMLDALGTPIAPVAIDSTNVVGVQSVAGASVTGNTPEIWFNQTGGHAAVSSSGEVSSLTSDATVLLTSGEQILVRGITGMIE